VIDAGFAVWLARETGERSASGTLAAFAV